MHIGSWQVEVRRVELGEARAVAGRAAARLVPSHTVTELVNHSQGELHEINRSLEIFRRHASRDIEGMNSSSNLLHRASGQTSEVGSSYLREEAFHQQGHRVVVGNDDQCARTLALGLLQIENGQPKYPLAERLQTVELLNHRRSDFAGAFDESNEFRKLPENFAVQPDVLHVGFNLLELVVSPIQNFHILGRWLAGPVVGTGGRRSRRTGAVITNEVPELRSVFPGIHLLDDLQWQILVSSCVFPLTSNSFRH